MPYQQSNSRRREKDHRRHSQTSQRVLSFDSDFYNSLSGFRNRTAHPPPLHHRKRRLNPPTRHNNQSPLLHNHSGKNPSRHCSRKNGTMAHHPRSHHRPNNKSTPLLPRPRRRMVLPHTNIPRPHPSSLRSHGPRHNTRPSATQQKSHHNRNIPNIHRRGQHCRSLPMHLPRKLRELHPGLPNSRHHPPHRFSALLADPTQKRTHAKP